MLMMDGGAAQLRFAHRRLHEWPPEGGVSTWCRSIPLDSAGPPLAQSEALLRALDWSGPAMVEYRYDPATGRSWLMEVNGRFWGSLPLAYHARHDFAWASYCAALPRAGAPDQPAYRRIDARFMIPETRRLFHILRHGGAEGRMRALFSYLWGFLDWRMRYYVWALDDPAPLLRDVWTVVSRRGR